MSRLLFFIFLLSSWNLDPVTASADETPRGYVVNAVLVDPTSEPNVYQYGDEPFFISVFEASCRDKREKLGEEVKCFERYNWNNFGITEPTEPVDDKRSVEDPAYFSLAEAQQFCQAAGGRLPTSREWILAAFDLNHNHAGTDYSDRLLNSKGVPTGNFGGKIRRLLKYSEAVTSLSLSVERVTDFSALGIDVSGTVGMTGNVQEATFDPIGGQSRGGSSSILACGFNFETSTEDITSAYGSGSKPCRETWELSGVRCVFDYSDKTYQIFDSGKVHGYLQAYIQDRQSQRVEKISKGKNNGSLVGFFPAHFRDLGGASHLDPTELESLKQPKELVDQYQTLVFSYLPGSPSPSQQTQSDAEGFTIQSDMSAGDLSPQERLVPPVDYGSKLTGRPPAPDALPGDH